MKFYIETFGCTANMGNSIEAETELVGLGHTPSCLEEADVVIVNTCAVTEKTERKIKKRLCQLQGKRLIIAGCLTAALPESLLGIKCQKKLGVLHSDNVRDIFTCVSPARPISPAAPISPAIPMSSAISIHPAVHRTFAARISPVGRSAGESHSTGEKQGLQKDSACGIINISEGCRGKCSYCIVRKARGKLSSRPVKDIVDSARKLIASGAVEIQLSAQDTAAYGCDIGTNLPELLREISKIPGRHRIRVGMMNPDTAMPILDDLTDAFKSPRVYKFLHMPLQSGSDRILAEMGRGYSSGDFKETISRFRSVLGEISLTTDVIAGFPGESDEDFDSTLKLIGRVEPDKVNVTRFSARPGTAAAELYDMPDRLKKERSRKMTWLWMEIASRRNRRYEGAVLEAVVTERGRDETMKARSENYSGIVVAGKMRLGSSTEVKIIKSNPFYLTGIAQSRPKPIAICTLTLGDMGEI